MLFSFERAGGGDATVTEGRAPGRAGRRAGRDSIAAGDGTAAGRDGTAADASSQQAPARADAAVGRFVEQFSALLFESGIPRMPARAFVALLTSDAGQLTAADLADQLQASPAAVSGAVRYLIGVGLIRRESEPGSRRHHYRIPADVWQEMMTLRDRLMARWTAAMREGITILGADTPAGMRMAESAQYFEFVSAELPRTIARWEEHKAALARRPQPPS